MTGENTRIEFLAGAYKAGNWSKGQTMKMGPFSTHADRAEILVRAGKRAGLVLLVATTLDRQTRIIGPYFVHSNIGNEVVKGDNFHFLRGGHSGLGKHVCKQRHSIFNFLDVARPGGTPAIRQQS